MIIKSNSFKTEEDNKAALERLELQPRIEESAELKILGILVEKHEK